MSLFGSHKPVRKCFVSTADFAAVGRPTWSRRIPFHDNLDAFGLIQALLAEALNDLFVKYDRPPIP